jgi:hypothetical protein
MLALPRAAGGADVPVQSARLTIIGTEVAVPLITAAQRNTGV